MVLYGYFGVTLQSDRDRMFLFFFCIVKGQERSVPVKSGRKAVYHLPVVFGTLFFLPLEYLFAVYISKLVMVGSRDRNCIHPSKK